MTDRITDLLTAVHEGRLTVGEARARLGDAETALGFAVVDDSRHQRTGQHEVVYGEGKTAEQLGLLLAHLVERHGRGLATRVDAEKAAAVAARWPDVRYEPVPRLLWAARPGLDPFLAPEGAPRVAVICAGTSDLPVGEEAARVAEWSGLVVDRVTDVGVAGLHRLLGRIERVRAADVCVVVAGMEGALPSVVAGLVATPVIAVPTSVGYGAHFGGIAPLLAMLNACASGITVVNIDNGFGAANAAFRMTRRPK